MNKTRILRFNWRHTRWFDFLTHFSLAIAISLIALRGVDLARNKIMLLIPLTFLAPVVIMLARRMMYRLEIIVDEDSLQICEGVMKRRKTLTSKFEVEKVVKHVPAGRASRYILCNSNEESFKFGGLISDKNLDKIVEELSPE